MKAWTNTALILPELLRQPIELSFKTSCETINFPAIHSGTEFDDN